MIAYRGIVSLQFSWLFFVLLIFFDYFSADVHAEVESGYEENSLSEDAGKTDLYKIIIAFSWDNRGHDKNDANEGAES